MKRNPTSIFFASLSLLAATGVALIAGCHAVGAPESSEEEVGAVDQALTAEQCLYFDANGKGTTCPHTGAANKPYTPIKISNQGCINGHAGHAGDYITGLDPSSPIYDPTCNGQGCLPTGGPCDGTLECCDGLTCNDGTCQPVAVCPCAVFPEWGPANYTSCNDWQSLNIIRLASDTGGYIRVDANFSFCGTPSGSFRPTGAALQACVDDVRAFDAASNGLCGLCDGLCPSAPCTSALGGTPSCDW